MKKLFTSFFILVSSFVFSQTPTFQWASKCGSTNWDAGHDVTIDALGNNYVIGEFFGNVDFDPGPSTFYLNAGTQTNTFLLKLDPFGNFVWVKQITGPGSNSIGKSVTLDVLGNILCTGYFGNTADFDPGPGTYNLYASTYFHIFVLKLDPTGNFMWAKNMGGTCPIGNKGNSIDTDALGNIITTGVFSDTTDFDPGISTYSLVAIGGYDIFVSKLDVNGNFMWAKQIGSDKDDNGYSISLDASDNIYVTGDFQDTADFDPGIGVLNTVSSGWYDSFILKLNTSGNLVWVNKFGGSGWESGFSICVDISNNILSTGVFRSQTDFDPSAGTFLLNTSGISDEEVYILKLSSSGSLIWAKKAGGTSDDHGNCIETDVNNNVYVSGEFNATADFDPGIGISNLTSNGGFDMFILKLNSFGNFAWVQQTGSASNVEDCFSIAVGPSSCITSTGRFSSILDFDPSLSTYTLSCAGNSDIFIQNMCQGTTNLTDLLLNNNLLLFPNPTADQFNLELNGVKQKTEIKIFNSIGQAVLQKTILNTDKINLNISDQPAGIYFVEINADGESYRAKVVKE